MGPACRIFLMADVDEVSDGFLRLLQEQQAQVESTRKGHSWDFWIAARPYSGQAQPTANILDQIEDDLLDCGLLPEDARTTISLSSGLNGAADYEQLKRLGEALVEMFGGGAKEPVK